jgi:dTDP-glucose 4,6-dehydratase
MTILVTGAAGFIGSNFVMDWFKQYSEDIVSLDLLTYAGNLENLSDLQNNPKHHFVHGNISDSKLVDQILRKYQIRAIIHFAAESHVDRSIHSPDDFIQTNIVGTYRLLESARLYWKHQKRLFVFYMFQRMKSMAHLINLNRLSMKNIGMNLGALIVHPKQQAI